MVDVGEALQVVRKGQRFGDRGLARNNRGNNGSSGKPVPKGNCAVLSDATLLETTNTLKDTTKQQKGF